MKYIYLTATLALFGYIAYIAHCVDVHLQAIQTYSYNESKSKERCENSIHAYLDALVPTMGGVQEKEDVPVVDTTYPQPLDASQYP